jgi:hypothetical protein
MQRTLKRPTWPEQVEIEEPVEMLTPMDRDEFARGLGELDGGRSVLAVLLNHRGH